MEVTSSVEDGTTIRCLLTSETKPKQRRTAEAA
jgi:hypothetical protein